MVHLSASFCNLTQKNWVSLQHEHTLATIWGQIQLLFWIAGWWYSLSSGTLTLCGQPERLRWWGYSPVTCPVPSHPGMGHLVSLFSGLGESAEKSDKDFVWFKLPSAFSWAILAAWCSLFCTSDVIPAQSFNRDACDISNSRFSHLCPSNNGSLLPICHLCAKLRSIRIAVSFIPFRASDRTEATIQ